MSEAISDQGHGSKYRCLVLCLFVFSASSDPDVDLGWDALTVLLELAC